MEVEVQYDERGNVDGLVVENPRSPIYTYEVPDETAGRWLKAYEAWDAVRDEIDRFTMVNKSKGQLEREARDEAMMRKYYL